MACALIIIGYNANDIVPSAALADTSIKEIFATCDNCENGIVVSVAARTSPPGYDVTRTSTFPPKPAETYVLRFVDGEAADGWVDTYEANLVGKTLIQIDPAV